MAKIVDVTPLAGVPGAGELHFDDGRPPLPVDPQLAEDHRAKLGIPSAMANGVAGPGSGTPDLAAADRADFVNTVKGAADWFVHGDLRKPIGQQSPGAAPAPAPPAPGVRVASPAEWAANQPPPAAPAPQAAPGPQQPPPASIALDQGQAPQGEPVDPTVALAQEIIARKEAAAGGGGPARMAPSSEKTEVTRGTPYDIGQARDRLTADEAVKEAAFSKMRAEKAGYDAQAAAAAAQIPKLQLDQARAQNEVDQRQKDYRIERAGLEKELDDYDKSAEVDPRRFFSGDRAISGMMSVIGAGLGAAGATLGHTQNWAFESMQKQIQQDIDAQVQAINSGHATRATALKRFVDYYDGDMSKAQNALGIAMNKAVSTEAMRFAAQSKSRDIANNAASFSALFDQNSQKREQDLYNASLGTSKTELTSKMQGGAGSGGPKTTLDDLLKYQKLMGGHGKDSGALGLPAQAVARQKAAYSTKSEGLAAFGDSLTHRARLMGLRFDPVSGELSSKEGKPAQERDLDVPIGAGAIGKHLASDALTPEAKELRRAEVNSVRLHAAQVYNHSISAEEGEKEVDDTIGNTDRAKLANMRYLADEYRRRKAEIDTGAASIDPRIVNERDDARRALNWARAHGQPLPGPTPRAGGGSGDTASDTAGEMEPGNE